MPPGTLGPAPPCRAGHRDLAERDTWFRTPVSALPAPAARLSANIQTTGMDGGHDLHYRTLQAIGVELVGRLAGVDGHQVRFADDLTESVAWGDARYADIDQLLAAQLRGRAPHWPDPPPFRADPPVELNLRGFGAVIFTSGFRRDYAGWVRLPAFDSMDFPITDDGASTVAPGLYFCRVHFLRTPRVVAPVRGGGRTPQSSPTQWPDVPAEPGRSASVDSLMVVSGSSWIEVCYWLGADGPLGRRSGVW